MKLCLASLLALNLSLFAFGQDGKTANSSSTLAGRIFDGMGAGMPNAKMLFTYRDGRKIEYAPDNEGFYEICLERGYYKIEVRREAFRTYILDNYFIHGRSVMKLDVALDVEPIIDTVTITPKKPE